MFGFGDTFFGNIKYPSSSGSQRQSCHRVTQKVGNMVTTYTQCS